MVIEALDINEEELQILLFAMNVASKEVDESKDDSEYDEENTKFYTLKKKLEQFNEDVNS